MGRSLERLSINQIITERFSLLPDTLSPARLNLVDDFYEHVRHLCSQFGGISGNPPAAIALGVPEVGPEGIVNMRFPVYEALGDFSSDPVASVFRERAKQDKLEFSAADCLVGVTLGFLAQDKRVRRENFNMQLTEDVSRLDQCDDTWLELENPEIRYRGCFRRAWDISIPASWHYIRPIVLDHAGIFAAFAVDFIAKSEQSPFSLLRENIERLLLGIYKSYYCHFGASKSLVSWGAKGRILDRRYLEGLTDALDREGLSSCFPGAASCAVFFCDGDGIKRVNDQYGHEWGNEVIQMLASVLCDASESLRLGDHRFEGVIDTIVVRWAGDEFVVTIPLLPGINASEAAMRFKHALESYLAKGCELIKPEGKGVSVDLSVGWTEWIGAVEGSFREAWLERAEHAMYVAKDGAKLLESLRKKESRGDDNSGKRTQKPPRVSMAEYKVVMGTVKELSTRLGMTLE